ELNPGVKWWRSAIRSVDPTCYGNVPGMRIWINVFGKSFGDSDTGHARAGQIGDGYLKQKVQHLEGIPVPIREGSRRVHGVISAVRANRKVGFLGVRV